MVHRHLLLSGFLLLSICTKSYAQTETYYTIKKGEVLREKFSNVGTELKFEFENAKNQEALTIGLGALAANLIPLLVDGASKLFYNPDNFNKEYFANYSFFNHSGEFENLDPNKIMVFEKFGENEFGQHQLITKFEFDLGVVKNVEGYHFIGLKSYHLPYSWSKLSSSKNVMNYILDIGFYYFDDDDKAQEFHIKPILLDAQVIGKPREEIQNINFQVIPKMKVLQTIQLRIREINAKTQNWNRYLELYQSNQNNISRFLIKAVSK